VLLRARFLFDENLSPSIAERLKSTGVDVLHIRDFGWASKKVPDHVVMERAYAQDRIVITANADDFIRLARRNGIHPGLIFLPGEVTSAGAMKALERAFELLGKEEAAGRDLINRVLWLRDDGSHEFCDEPTHPPPTRAAPALPNGDFDETPPSALTSLSGSGLIILNALEGNRKGRSS
jgi:predicted nuclease of predicted toxin-antitoxin system